MNYPEAVSYLFSLGRELASPRQAQTAKFGLGNITTLAETLGRPERAYRSVHVAGTNGKGSTAAMIASILVTSGFRTGLYTSPHLERINERIQVNGSEISDTDFAAVFTRVREAIEELLATGALAAHPTFFECVTAMAFEFFARQNVDVAVFEVGMGGRLDSTNIIRPEVAVITQIDFDHENFLGHSIQEIAREKAGIIKPGVAVVSAAENPMAEEVIRKQAEEQGAWVVRVKDRYRTIREHCLDGRYRFDIEVSSGSPIVPAQTIRATLPLPGLFQTRNALTAVAAACILRSRGLDIPNAAVEDGLATVRWPGRIELLRRAPDVYLDGTHNPAGARELVTFWKDHLAGRRIHLVYGAMRDKAVDEVAGLLFPLAATITVTQSKQPRSISANVLAGMTGHLSETIAAIVDPLAAFHRALEQSAPEDVVFVTGSLYLVGDLRKELNRTFRALDRQEIMRPTTSA